MQSDAMSKASDEAKDQAATSSNAAIENDNINTNDVGGDNSNKESEKHHENQDTVSEKSDDQNAG